MIDQAWAESFARDWQAHWNARNLAALLAHYSPDVIFRSPRIARVLGTNVTSLHGIDALRDYWSKALAMSPLIRFEVERVGVGGDAVTIVYRNHRGEHVAETLVFGPDCKVAQGIVTYLTPLPNAVNT